jgi:outer membrane protein assembly factor BamD
MLRSKLSVVFALMLATVALLMVGCSSAPVDKTASMTPEQIYADGKEMLSNGSYDKAISLFDKLEGRAAGTLLAQQAQLEKAYAYYKTDQNAQALVTLDRFIKLHPASPVMDYAYYFKGVINFNEDLGLFSWFTRQDLSERDQQAAKESFASFKEVVIRFPTSRYALDAKQRMGYIVNLLAQYEVHVARYYYSRGAYLASINRVQQALIDYNDAPVLEDALFILYKCYESLGMAQQRDDAKRVLELNYPQSEYLTSGFKTKSEPWWKLW